jgi:hypothetical protein
VPPQLPVADAVDAQSEAVVDFLAGSVAGATSLPSSSATQKRARSSADAHRPPPPSLYDASISSLFCSVSPTRT